MIRSPYFNKEVCLISAFDELYFQIDVCKDQIDEKKIFKAAYPDKPFNASFLRVLLSKIYQLILTNLHLEESSSIFHIQIQQSALSHFRSAHYNKLFTEFSSKQQNYIQDLSYKNDQSLEYQYHLLLENYQFEVSQRRDGNYNIEEISDCIDSQFLIRKLKNFCRLLNVKAYTLNESETLSLKYIENFLLIRKDLLTNKVLSFYHKIFLCFYNQFSEYYYGQAMPEFIQNENLFSTDESRENYLMLINYGIRKINSGSESYRQIVFELYKKALDRKLLFENNKISRFTYRNITETALKLKKYQWADQFIISYKSKLEPAYQKYLFSFEKSRILSEQGQFNEALEYIVNLSFEDEIMEVACRLERIKIFVELNEIELAEYQLNSMNSYIRRNVSIGYQASYYKNFVKYLLKIIKAKDGGELKLKMLYNEINLVEKISDKKWILEKCK
ncbi:MAG: hypothetical protein ABI851_09480 [Saprospiraceae bacterium]